MEQKQKCKDLKQELFNAKSDFKNLFKKIGYENYFYLKGYINGKYTREAGYDCEIEPIEDEGCKNCGAYYCDVIAEVNGQIPDPNYEDIINETNFIKFLTKTITDYEFDDFFWIFHVTSIEIETFIGICEAQSMEITFGQPDMGYASKEFLELFKNVYGLDGTFDDKLNCIKSTHKAVEYENKIYVEPLSQEEKE